MGAATDHAIADLRAGPGELSFEARVGGTAKRIFYRTETAVTPSADAALASCLMPAMTGGGRLTMSDPVSPRLLRTQGEFQGVQRAWSAAWHFGKPQLREVEVLAPTREVAPRPPTGRVAAFFSGGVDSWSTVLENPEVTDLIFVRGFDLLPGAAHQVGLAERVEERVAEAAEALGLTLHTVETNVRELSDPLVHWEAYYTSPLAALALFFEPLFDRVLIAGVCDYARQHGLGASRLVDQQWSTERLEIVQDGGRFSRSERTARIAEHPVAQGTLRVCWENPDGAYNCGRCRKCLMTMATLEALGARGRFTTFPAELDLEALARVQPLRPVSMVLWRDVHAVARRSGRPELERATEAVLENGRRRLGGDVGDELREDAAAGPVAEHAIADLRAGPGELSFEARIGGTAKRIFYRTETAVTPSADAALASCLMPAMTGGGRLTISDPVSPRLLRTQREFQGVQRGWSRSPSWEFGGAPLREVEVLAPTREVAPRPPTGRVAAFFSGGVDSWSTVLENPEVTDLIFVRGLDIRPDTPYYAELADEVERRLREAAAGLGLTLHTVETNVRELSDPLLRWETYFACPLVAVALFFEPLFDRVLLAGDTDYETQLPYGVSWNVDGQWSTERLEIVDEGGRSNRERRLRRIVEHPAARRSLRVCWENPEGVYNCGRCRKCMITKLSLEALGVREQVTSFTPDLDPGLLASLQITQMVSLVLFEDAAETAREAGRDDLLAALEPMLARGRATLGLPPSHRCRPRLRAAALGGAPGGPAAPLLATEETAAKVAEARAAALLVGGYDGSGNFGDLAQLDATLALLEPLGPGLLVLPLVELERRDDHEALAGEMQNPPKHVLYFDPEGRGGAGLVAVAPPRQLAYAACWLYGGGYLNPHWGDRKLAMLSAAEALAHAGGAQRVIRLASGLQVDGGWLAGLDAAERERLRSFELLGGRDRGSCGTLEQLGPPAAVIDSGDDAVGAMADLETVDGRPQDGPLRVNLHFAAHGWISDDGERLLSFLAGLLAQLGRDSARRIVVQPLFAYADSRIDERPHLARLEAACAAHEVSFEEAMLLRPAGLAARAATMRRAQLTLACSYHVALTSLMIGVPAALIQGNRYYEQKADGLTEAFVLPAGLRVSPDEDPAAVAARISAETTGERGAALREHLPAAAAERRQRRSKAETMLVGRLGAGALDLLATRGEARSGQQLQELLGSRSWRLTEPLRRAGARLRRLRRR